MTTIKIILALVRHGIYKSTLSAENTIRKREYIESATMIKQLLLFVSLFMLVSCSKQDKEPYEFKQFDVNVEINICDPPFYAIGDDTISDAKAIKLALDVVRNIKANTQQNIYYNIKTSLIVPGGNFIIDESIDFADDTLLFKPRYGMFQFKGSNISITGGTFIMTH
jgi:hypothetical protein